MILLEEKGAEIQRLQFFTLSALASFCFLLFSTALVEESERRVGYKRWKDLSVAVREPKKWAEPHHFFLNYLGAKSGKGTSK